MKKMFIPINEFSRPGKKLTVVSGLVFHWVNNPRSTAKQNAEYFASLSKQDPTDADPDRFASTHYICDWDETIQCVPEDEMCYHVGAWEYRKFIPSRLGKYPNAQTIGIEICHPDESGEFDVYTKHRVEQLAVDISIRNDLDPMTDFYRHFDVTGKICPKYWVDHAGAWFDFLKAVKIAKKTKLGRIERGNIE